MHGILPTAYFGSVAYFRRWVQLDSVTLEAHEHFPKQTYRNRCDIVGADGILSLSIPVSRPNGNHTRVEEIILSDHENWRARHWRSIVSAYQSAPYFDHYGSMVHDLLQTPTSSLFELNTEITRSLLSWLDLPSAFSISEEFADIQTDDDRQQLVAKSNFQEAVPAPYIQVFPGAENFRPSLSMLDALFCEGPLARSLLFAAH